MIAMQLGIGFILFRLRGSLTKPTALVDYSWIGLPWIYHLVSNETRPQLDFS